MDPRSLSHCGCGGLAIAYEPVQARFWPTLLELLGGGRGIEADAAVGQAHVDDGFSEL